MFKLKQRLIRIISQHPEQPEEKVKLDSDRDYSISPAEAKEYGLVDAVIKSPKESKLLDNGTTDRSTSLECPCPPPETCWIMMSEFGKA